MDLNAEVDQLVRQTATWIPMVMEYGSRLLLALVTLAIGWWVTNKVSDRLARLVGLRVHDPALQTFIRTLANIVLKILLAISVASMIGIETTSFVAAIGGATLAIGLALQGSLANFAGGVRMLMFRPVRIGDWSEAQGVSGTVDSSQSCHTVLRTGDNKTGHGEADDPTIDAGYKTPKVSVGDYVWSDEDGDGIQDEGEPGIPGVELDLVGTDGKPVTDVNGNTAEPTETDEHDQYPCDELPVLPPVTPI